VEERTVNSKTQRRDGPVAEENRRAGTTEWQLRNCRFDDPVTLASYPLVRRLRSSAVEGYVSSTSVYQGGSVDIKVSLDPPGAFRIEVYRMGFYGSAGGRHMATLGPFEGRTQPVPMMTVERLRECEWESCATLSIPEEWPSGVYLGKLVREEFYGPESYVVFIVKERRRSDILWQLSDLTWQAYNRWPGNDSLYNDGTPAVWYGGPNVRVSFDRPYAKFPTIMDSSLSIGSGEFLLWEHPMAFWLEQQGYDVTYCSNLDLERDPEVLDRCKVMLSVGHDEYWSREMFERAGDARDGGMSIAFFSGNSVHHEIETYDAATGDPARAFARRRRFDDEEGLMGVKSFGVGYGDWTVTRPGHWIFKGTGMGPGDAIRGLIGWEYHGAPADIDGLEVVASGPLLQPPGPAQQGPPHSAVVYPGPAGGWVFNAGTIWWPEGLACPPGHMPARHTVRPMKLDACPGTFGVDPRVQRITRNLIDRMIEESPRRW
jgi:hypothetical protein